MYSQSEAFDFPVGSALVKTFAYPADFREPDQNMRLVETRVLLRQAQGWQALAYVWNEAQSDAELKIAGKRLPVEFIDEQRRQGVLQLCGAEQEPVQGLPCNQWRSRADRAQGAQPQQGVAGIGRSRRTSLKPGRRPGFSKGCLSRLPCETAAAMATKRLPVDARARTWLDVNCAHCHRREGPASNSGLFLDCRRERTW